MMRRTILALALAALAGCGGGSAVTHPSDAVESVAVTPATVALEAGDTARLVATPHSASGAVISGKSVGWSSNAPSVAAVSAAGTVTAVSAGTATITASVDGKSGDARVTVTAAAQVVLDAGRAVSASIGFAGGTLTATSSANLVYQLTIPPGALDQATTITVAPLSAFRRLPLSGGLVGAVLFSPDGQSFRSPVTLTIQAAPNLAAGQRLVGFSFAANGGALRLQPAELATGRITLSITHFSGAGAGLGTVQDLAALPPPPNSSAQDTALVALAGLLLPADQAAIVAALRQWQSAILARLALANTDVSVRDARLEAAAWVVQLNQYPLPDVTALRTALATELAALRTSLSAALLRGIASANQQCTAQQSLVAARNALFLQAAAEADSIAASGSPLARATVLAGLCVRPVVIDSLYPQSPQLNVSAPLDLRVGLAFVNATPVAVQFIPFGLSLNVSGSTNDRAFTASTTAGGQFSTPLAPTGAATLQVNVTACPDPATFLFNYPCVAFAVSRAFGRTITGNTVIATQADLQGLSDVSKVVGSLTISGNAISSTDLHELGQLSEVTGTLVLVSLPNVTTLSGLRGVRGLSKLGGLIIQSLPNLASLHGLEGLGGTLQSLVLVNLPLLTALDPLAGVLSIGSLQLNHLPALPTLNGLGAATVTTAITVIGLPALNGLGGIGAVADPLSGSVMLLDNPNLQDLGPLRNVRSIQADLWLGAMPDPSGLNGLLHVGGNLTLDYPTSGGPFHFSGLSGLTSIGKDFQLAGASLTQFSGLAALQTVGGDVTLFTRLLPLVPVIRFGALATVEGAIRIDNSVCDPAAVTKEVDFPALVRAFSVGISGPTSGSVPASCAMALDLSALQAVGFADPALGTGNLVFTGESLTSLKIGPLTHVVDFGVTQPLGNPSTNLTSLTFSHITGRSLAVSGQTALRSLSISSLTLSQGIFVEADPVLSALSISGVSLNRLDMGELPALTSVSASGSGLAHAEFRHVALSQTQMFNLVRVLGLPSGSIIFIDGSAVQLP